MRILRFLIFYFYHRLSANDQARFLHLDQGIFRRSLQNLHSVIYVPSVGESHRARPRVYHTSFSDFLKDPNRSGKFWLNPDAAMNDVALQSLHWMENDDRSQSNETLIEFSVLHGWHACWNLPNDFIPGLINRLEHFNFSHITQAHIIADDVAKLLKRLYSLVRKHLQQIPHLCHSRE
ncbi:hypothetical protein P691DRAFT_414734 [Macrolepiota fuliginosa MF-IS2]|uniref:Uncharacterized protein n=1 Tax=Macrolepiota fuliginosa MF-IS2 TaxID=1400762 RepID=A0A9P6C6L6_9AGAR|nr:hypothetical protein P691DRAFT_414734 [Macrolepiota fuliginosa MF-IS2]